MFKHTLLLLILITGIQGTAHSATTIDFSVGDLNTFINDASLTGDDLSRFIGSEIQNKLSANGLQLNEDGLTISGIIPGQEVRSNCSSNVNLNQSSYTIRVNSQSRLEIVLDTLKDPIFASLDLFGNVAANGSFVIRYGFKVLGKCVRYAEDNVGFSAAADVGINIGLKIDFNPSVKENADGSITIAINPTTVLSGNVNNFSNVDVQLKDFDTAYFVGIGFFGNVLRNAVEKYAEAAYTVTDLNNSFQAALVTQNRNLRIQLAKALLSNTDFLAWQTAFNDNPDTPILVEYNIPNLDLEMLQKIQYFLSKLPSGFPITVEFLKNNQRDIVYNLLIGDYDALAAILGSSLACEASQALLTKMKTTPLYTFDGASCSEADLTVNQTGTYYSEPSCTYTANFKPSSYAEYCQDVMTTDKSRLGNAALFDGVPQAWTLSPGNQLDISPLTIKNNYQPFMFKEKYKTTVDAVKGECKLEMRVYKKNIYAHKLKPMMAIHGGGWSYRSAAFVGLESQISHYTDKGFAVFVPFYRLVGNSDGNSECNQAAWSDVVEDAEDALTWVKNNMSRFGASGKISVMGQSAGGHLAAWLATYRSSDIQNALLYYPPVDFQYIIEQFRLANKNYVNGQGTLETFVGESLDTIDITSPVIAKNSFPDIVATNPTVYPPMFIIHGKRDSLVPSELSVRMCNALSGYPESGPAVDDGGDTLNNVYKKVYQCDNRGSQLHLTAEGEHALDVCIASIKCNSGSDASIAETANTIRDAKDWLYNSQDVTPVVYH